MSAIPPIFSVCFARIFLFTFLDYLPTFISTPNLRLCVTRTSKYCMHDTPVPSPQWLLCWPLSSQAWTQQFDSLSHCALFLTDRYDVDADYDDCGNCEDNHKNNQECESYELTSSIDILNMSRAPKCLQLELRAWRDPELQHWYIDSWIFCWLYWSVLSCDHDAIASLEQSPTATIFVK